MNVESELRQTIQEKFFGNILRIEGYARRPTQLQPGPGLKLITAGTVTVLHHPGSRGPSIRLAILTEGDFLGEITCFHGASSASLESRTGVELTSLLSDGESTEQRAESMRANVKALIAACPQIGYNMAAELSWRLLKTNRYLDSIASDRIRYTVALREIECRPPA